MTQWRSTSGSRGSADDDTFVITNVDTMTDDECQAFMRAGHLEALIHRAAAIERKHQERQRARERSINGA